MTKIVTTGHGRPATTELAKAITAAKGGFELAPVTVVVPSNFAGLVARRVLGSGSLGGRGLANVNFFTPFRLAELCSVGQMRGKRPLTNPVLAAAVRQTLADDPGHFARVRDHQATEQAVAAAVGELSNVRSDLLDAIAAKPGFASGVVEVHRRVVDRLRGFHDEAELARAATHRDDLGSVLEPFGHVIWYLPGVITAPLGLFLRAALGVCDSTVIIARSGNDKADGEVRRALKFAGLGHAYPDREGDVGASSPTAGAVQEPLASHVVSVTDADEEVRHVIRQVMGLIDAGVALDRIGVFHPVPDPYVRILEQQLAASGLAANGPSRRRLSESIAGRVLLGALALPSDRWRRDRVMALISTGPLRHAGEQVRPSRWDTLSREAGVVIDRRDWTVRLDGYRKRLADAIVEAERAGHARLAEAMAADRAEAGVLAEFVDSLVEAVDAVLANGSWQARSEAALALLRGLLGAAHQHGWWPESEQVTFERVESALERLAALDEIEPDPSGAVFVRALGDELSVARERSGRFGTGLVYGPLSSAGGHDLDAVFILGCAEGLAPAPRREDALLSETARAEAGDELVSRLEQIHEQHRLFLAALAAAPADRRWLLFPRGDLRSSRRARPSRWLLASASKLANKKLFATDFDDETPSELGDIESHAEGIVRASHAASLEERDLSEVLAFVRENGDAIDHPAAIDVRAGLAAQRARRSAEFTEYDGNLAGQALPSMVDQVWSASRLETWAACGFRYFLGHVLGLSDRDDPERTIELSALDRGSAMHKILEDFLSGVVAAGKTPAPDEPWSDEQRAEALAIADEVFSDYEARGRTGRAVIWGAQKRELNVMIDEFLDADDGHRQHMNAWPARFELPFGLAGADPVEIEVGDGRTLKFRGLIDRIDEVRDGDAGDCASGSSRIIVSDYKTGKGKKYDKLDREPDPTKAGTVLQLGLYAEAAHQLLGAKSVDSRYWMVDQQAGYARLGYEWTAEHRERLTEVVSTIARGVEEGVFAAAPGDWESFRRAYAECKFCEFDELCPRDRAEHANDKADDPALQVRVALTPRPGEPTEPEAANSNAGNSDAGEPEPAKPDPTEPDAAEPADPEAVEPADPEAAEPVEPGAREPGAGNSDAGEPDAAEPADPEAAEPVEPGAVEPADPDAVETVEPGAAEPADPGAAEPVETVEHDEAGDIADNVIQGPWGTRGEN